MPRTQPGRRRTSRSATHSGSWYTDSPSALSAQIASWMDEARRERVSAPLQVPSTNTRAIIAPHAGYAYSGRTMAYAYSCLPPPDTIKTIFVLGPSHHFYTDKCHISQCSQLDTPLGPLVVDRALAKELLESDEGVFAPLGMDDDEAEHSIEMHLPYVAHYVHSSSTQQEVESRIVPIVVGALSPAREREVGRALAPYITRRDTIFIVSSDFCHWGRRFGYQFHLGERFEHIHESIAWLDSEGMKAIEKKEPEGFVEYLKEYQNTICGRHPIGVLLCALAEAHGGDTSKYEVSFTKYDRSGLVEGMEDSSVSYCSAYVSVRE
jgi:AmmeMemoRadiSam system protein B